MTAHRRIAREDAEAEADAQALFAAITAGEDNAAVGEENDQFLGEQSVEKEGTLGDREKDSKVPASGDGAAQELKVTGLSVKPVDEVEPQRSDSVQGAQPTQRRGRRRATSRRQYPEDMLSWGA